MIQRDFYKENPNYVFLHDYLNNILFTTERNVDQFLENKGLKNLMVKKVLVSAKIDPILTYSLAYDFFEESDEIDKETRVSFVAVVTLNTVNSSFDVSSEISSFYEMNYPGWFKNLNEFSGEVDKYYENVPSKFLEVLERFFTKEFEYREV